MVEILFLCGTGKRAVVAFIGGVIREVSGLDDNQVLISFEMLQSWLYFHIQLADNLFWNVQQKVDAALEGLSLESAIDFQKVLRISTFTSRKDAFNMLLANIPLFQSRLGAMLFLISSLLSRGLVCLCLCFVVCIMFFLLAQLNKVQIQWCIWTSIYFEPGLYPSR